MAIFIDATCRLYENEPAFIGVRYFLRAIHTWLFRWTQILSMIDPHNSRT